MSASSSCESDNFGPVSSWRLSPTANLASTQQGALKAAENAIPTPRSVSPDIHALLAPSSNEFRVPSSGESLADPTRFRVPSRYDSMPDPTRNSLRGIHTLLGKEDETSAGIMTQIEIARGVHNPAYGQQMGTIPSWLIPLIALAHTLHRHALGMIH